MDDVNQGTPATPFWTFHAELNTGMYCDSGGVKYCVDGVTVSQREFLIHCAKTGRLSQMYLITNDLGVAPFRKKEDNG